MAPIAFAASILALASAAAGLVGMNASVRVNVVALPIIPFLAWGPEEPGVLTRARA
jgi:hypothetical protein